MFNQSGEIVIEEIISFEDMFAENITMKQKVFKKQGRSGGGCNNYIIKIPN